MNLKGPSIFGHFGGTIDPMIQAGEIAVPDRSPPNVRGEAADRDRNSRSAPSRRRLLRRTVEVVRGYASRPRPAGSRRRALAVGLMGGIALVSVVDVVTGRSLALDVLYVV